jgi:hypothetical protein
MKKQKETTMTYTHKLLQTLTTRELDLIADVESELGEKLSEEDVLDGFFRDGCRRISGVPSSDEATSEKETTMIDLRTRCLALAEELAGELNGDLDCVDQGDLDAVLEGLTEDNLADKAGELADLAAWFN